MIDVDKIYLFQKSKVNIVLFQTGKMSDVEEGSSSQVLDADSQGISP